MKNLLLQNLRPLVLYGTRQVINNSIVTPKVVSGGQLCSVFKRNISLTPRFFKNEVSTQLGSSSPKSEAEKEIIDVTHKLIYAINNGDYKTYTEMCDKDLTSFEPEAKGNLVTGIPFHKYYFDHLMGKRTACLNTTIISPHVIILSKESACITYIRLTQTVSSDHKPVSYQSEETRVWQKRESGWVNVHFHRSTLTE